MHYYPTQQSCLLITNHKYIKIMGKGKLKYNWKARQQQKVQISEVPKSEVSDISGFHKMSAVW